MLAKVTNLPDFSVENDQTIIWRYMSADNFLDLINTSMCYFPNAKSLGDHFEGSLSDLEFKDKIYGGIDIPQDDLKVLKKYHKYTVINRIFQDLSKWMMINCWHINESESHLMWQTYGRQNKGVAIKSSVQRLKNSFEKYKSNPDYASGTIWLGQVKYIDFNTQNMDSNDLKRFFHKDNRFKAENELRVVINLTHASEFGARIPDGGIRVPVILNTLIESVFLDVSCEKKDEIVKALKVNKLNVPLRDSIFNDDPVF